ncbi:MAG: hypothetical protein J0H71_20355 [Rhizobiales bacterium]|nr:hypothetical protein [Hyphomicrobiales bacterium]
MRPDLAAMVLAILTRYSPELIIQFSLINFDVSGLSNRSRAMIMEKSSAPNQSARHFLIGLLLRSGCIDRTMSLVTSVSFNR